MQNTHPQLSLIEEFKTMADPRVDRTKDHDLIDILVIAVCALLCAAESFNDMEDFGKAKQDWFKTFLNLRNGIPSHDTFRHCVIFACSLALAKAGNNIAARIAMIAMTTSSSINVKPFVCVPCLLCAIFTSQGLIMVSVCAVRPASESRFRLSF